MKFGWKRIAAAVLTLAMVLSLLPVPEVISDAQAAGSYGRVTDNGVRVRKKADTNADYWFKLDAGYVCEVTDTVTAGGVKWYKVNAVHPDPNSSRTYVGYIHGDYFVMLTDAEAAAWEANPVQQLTGGTVAGGGGAAEEDPVTPPSTGVTAPTGGTSGTVSTTGATGEITNSGVNFRETEGGPVIQKLDRGTVVELLSIPATIDSDHWYRVRYNNHVGYIQAPYIRVISTGNLIAGNSNAGNTPTGQYVKLILSSANLRLSPGGTVGAQWEKKGQTLPVMGASVKQGGYTWYPVQFNSKTYYVRGDCVQLVASSGESAATPTPAPQANAQYVKLVLSSANLRTTPGGKVGAQWETTGEVLAVSGAVVKQGGYTWYPVKYNGNSYYVRGDCVQVVTSPGTVVTSAPTAIPSYKGYVKTTVSGVNLRLKPAGEYIQQVDKNVVLPVLADVVQQNGYGWYYVIVNNVKGYVRGDCVVVCDASGNPLASTVTSAPTTGTTSSYGYVKLTQDKVNLRAKPAGSSIEQLPLNQVLPMTGAAVKSGAYTWYPVRATSGKTGYVRSDCVLLCDKSGTPLQSEPTPAPDTGLTYGYIKTTTTSVNLRKTPAGTKVGSLGKNEVYALTGNPVTKSGYTWYPVNANGQAGYVRSDCAVTCDRNGNALNNSDANTATVNYVQTTVDKVNLRASASKDANAPYNVAQGTVMAYNNVKTVGGSKWYRVVYNNTEVWVLGSCVKVMTAAEYQAYIDSKPAATPQPEVVKGYVITTTSGVNLRTAANGATIIGRIDKGVVMPYAKAPEVVRGYTWYYVKSPANGYGYVRGDCVELCQQNGAPLPTVPPAQVGGDNSGKPEASYTTLKRGSTGTAVKALVSELKAQGFYSGTVTSTYTSAVETAVKAFQRAKGLTVDGIAGAKTQHMLFGTVEVGSSDTTNLTMAIYPAEKIDWYTGGINSLWAKGANYKVYDVKTGIVWWAHRWSGGSHVDAEPLTAADTARLCKIYGVSNAAQIESKNLWQRRPMLVTIGNRTFACSLYGIPHNYPDGDTIATNDFKGQLCIHFTNSKTHASNKTDTYHQEAIDYAWRNAPNGHK
ncbi:MAG: peptidoglycan-binding protein [Clostridia bacterium]|nr:peptidoglycan-binding protein [Clostridia bacterium]